MKRSNIIILAMIVVSIIVSFSFIISLKKEFKRIENTYIEGSENLKSDFVELEVFSEIMVFDQINLILSTGPQSVKISAEDNIMPYIKTDIEEGILSLYVNQESGVQLNNQKPIIVEISVPEIIKLTANGQSEIRTEGVLKFENLTIETNNQAYIRGSVEGTKLVLNSYGQSSVSLTGKVEMLKGECKQQTDLELASLNVYDANFELSEESRLEINVENILDAKLFDTSRLQLRKSPRIENIIINDRSSSKRLQM